MTLWLEWKNPASYLSWLVRDVLQLIELKVEPSFYDLIRAGQSGEIISVPTNPQATGNILYVHRRTDGAVVTIHSEPAVRPDWKSDLGRFCLWIWRENQWQVLPFGPVHCTSPIRLSNGIFYYAWNSQLWQMNLETLQEELYYDLTASPGWLSASVSPRFCLQHANANFWVGSHCSADLVTIYIGLIPHGTYRLISVKRHFLGFHTVISDTHLFIIPMKGNIVGFDLATGREDFSFLHPRGCRLEDRLTVNFDSKASIVRDQYSRDLFWVDDSIRRITTGEQLCSFPQVARWFFYARNNRLFRASLDGEFISCYE